MFRSTSFVFFPSNFRNPSSIVLDQPASTSMIILYCWTVYPGIVLVTPTVMGHTSLTSLHHSFLYSRSTDNSSPRLYYFLTSIFHYLCIDSVSLQFMFLPISWYIPQCLDILRDVFWLGQYHAGRLSTSCNSRSSSN